MFNLPNALTLLRIALIPILVLVFYWPHPSANVVTAALFAAAAITDWLDGVLARLLRQTSPLGAFLDPVADKLIVAVALVLLVQRHPSVWLALPAAVIIGREITISALREWMAQLGARRRVAVSWSGKLKTTAQMLALVLMLYREPVLGVSAFDAGFVLLYVAAALTLWSMMKYLAAAWPELRGGGPA